MIKKGRKNRCLRYTRNEESRTRKKDIKHLLIRVIVIIAVLAFSLIPAIFVGGGFGYIPAVVVLLAIAVSFLYGFALRRFVSYFELSEYSSCVRGSAMDFVVEFKNRSFLVFPRIEAVFFVSDLFGGMDSLSSAAFTLGAYETREFRFSINFAHIGDYSAGLRQLRIFDLLDIFRFKIDNRKWCNIEVNPRVHPYLDLNISDSALYESLHSWVVSPVQGMDYSGCREYVFGDPIKSIHWKLSAHSRTYMTKILESYGTSGVSVVLDLSSPAHYDTETEMSIFDGLVEAALSICYFASTYGMDYDLIYYNKEGGKRRYIPREFASTMDLMRELPKITTDCAVYDAVTLLIEERNNFFAKSNIAVCSSNITEKMIETLLDAKREGRNIMLFYVIPQDVYDRERAELLRPLKRLDDARIRYYVFNSAEELRKTG